MIDPAKSLLLHFEQALAELSKAGAVGVDVSLHPAPPQTDIVAQLATRLERPVPAGVAAFFTAYDGGVISRRAAGVTEPSTPSEDPEDTDVLVRFINHEEALALAEQGGSSLKGLWPIMQRGGQIVALDAESPVAEEAEWPVVQVADRSVDRLGSSLLRFLRVLLAEVAYEVSLPDERPVPGGAIELELKKRRMILAEKRCHLDPQLSDHWVDWADLLEEDGQKAAAQATLERGLTAASQPGPALLAGLGFRGLLVNDLATARAALEDAVSLEALTARDDDARLDASAMLLLIGLETGDTQLAKRSRSTLKNAMAATGAFWRAEAVRALAMGDSARTDLALRLLRILIPEDTDAAVIAENSPAVRASVAAIIKSRTALDEGDFDAAARAAREAIAACGSLAMAHALLAESLNALRSKQAGEYARKAIALNPSLVDGWRELGDALMEGRDLNEAIKAFDEGIKRDPAYGLLFAKKAQALLELGRRIEALDAIGTASELGGDAFFLAAVKGDILSAMERHKEAAESYDQALIFEPEDHWTLHQGALEHAQAGNTQRAGELFELALRYDRDGCHQTLVDYAQLLRQQGRIGDAVRLYRKAVAASPHDQQWRTWLKEAEAELKAAPN
ncbi:MAG: tetratricopeptide repeat protein [Deltaproteobacteria bacterium]|nr:tetratricopeptide repeat protein [Deltaproteobacteria bacterium]